MQVLNNYNSFNLELSLKTKMEFNLKEAQGGLESKNIEIKSREDAQKLNAKTISMQYVMEFQLKIEFNTKANLATQNGLETFNIPKIKDLLKDLDLSKIGYSGKPLTELTQQEAKELISEDGFFGIEQTAKRIADFVILGSGGDERLLKAGREGAIRGFKEAEALFGGKLPDIAYKTIEKALTAIDKVLEEKGIKVLDAKA